MEASEHPLLALIPASARPSYPLTRSVADAGDLLVASGQAVERTHFILEGEVRLIYRDHLFGVKSRVDTLGPGDLLGPQCTEQPVMSRYDAVASMPVVSVGVPAADFARMLTSCQEFALGYLSYLAAKSGMFEERAALAGRHDISRIVLDDDLLRRVSSQYISTKKVLPVAMHAGVVTVACATQDIAGLDVDMKRLLGANRVVPFRVGQKEFDRVFREVVQRQTPDAELEDDLVWFRSIKGRDYHVEFENAVDQPLETSRKEQDLDGNLIVSLTNRIIGEAMELGASDIHFEPYAGSMDVRYRLDGELYRRPERVPPGQLAAVLSRIKVLSSMDIAERRKPQDGRITVTALGKTVDVRVSSVPTRFGEKIVMRILDPSSMLIELDSLIDCREVLEAARWMLQQPYGMIMVAGPTGAGKTTTVYSMLLSMKEAPVNIMTVEDPIEYSLRGITQVQRNLHVNLDFPYAIRSFLRQDPDVIVVGETRDPETAKAGLEAGLTGHLVISTVHANNVFAAIYRLREMGMEPFVIANSVIGILSQRLVRRLCPHCAQTVQYHRSLIEPLELPNVGKPVSDHYLFMRGKGCLACNFKGFKGRAAVFESLRITDELKPVVASNVAFKEVERHARKAGAHFSMRAYAAALLARGITTPEEISRILFTQAS